MGCRFRLSFNKGIRSASQCSVSLSPSPAGMLMYNKVFSGHDDSAHRSTKLTFCSVVFILLLHLNQDLLPRLIKYLVNEMTLIITCGPVSCVATLPVSSLTHIMLYLKATYIRTS